MWTDKDKYGVFKNLYHTKKTPLCFVMRNKRPNPTEHDRMIVVSKNHARPCMQQKIIVRKTMVA